MKRIVFLLAIGALFMACTNPKEQSKKLVEEYMNEHYAILAPITVTEISDIDSLYTPFMEMASLTLQFSDLDLAAVKAYNQIDGCKTRKEFYQKKTELLDSLQAQYDNLSETLSKIMFGLDHPDISPKKNRTGVKATYSAMGKVNEGFFFFNADGKTIGHTSMENYTTFKDLLKLQSKTRSDISEVRYIEW